MYYCENCGCRFEEPREGFEPYPDWGGEVVWLCPICGIPDYFEELKEDEFDDEEEEEEEDDE